MKKLLPILFVLIITSCSKEVPLEQTVERNGITYEVNSEEPFTGTTVSYYENGQLEQRSTLKDGKEDGLQESYYENGQLEQKSTLKDGKKYGLWEGYYENGQLQYKENYKNGELDGTVFWYEKDGRSTTYEYKNGEIQ